MPQPSPDRVDVYTGTEEVMLPSYAGLRVGLPPSRSEGTCTAARATWRFTSVWIPNRVKGRPQRLRKHVRPIHDQSSGLSVQPLISFHIGQRRILFPLPRIRIDDGVRPGS